MKIPRTHPCPTCSTPRKAVAGADLRAARESAGLSLRQLATLGGMSAHSYLAAIERGESVATPEVVALYESLRPKPKERSRK